MKLIVKLAKAYSANHDEGWTCTDCCAHAGFMAGFHAANRIHADRCQTEDGAWGDYYRPTPNLFLGLNEEEIKQEPACGAV